MSFSVHRQRVLPPSIGTAIVGRTFFAASQRWSVTQWIPTCFAACCVEHVRTLAYIAYLITEVTKNRASAGIEPRVNPKLRVQSFGAATDLKFDLKNGRVQGLTVLAADAHRVFPVPCECVCRGLRK